MGFLVLRITWTHPIADGLSNDRVFGISEGCMDAAGVGLVEPYRGSWAFGSVLNCLYLPMTFLESVTLDTDFMPASRMLRIATTT